MLILSLPVFEGKNQMRMFPSFRTKYFFVYSFFDYSKMQVLVKLKAIPGRDTLVFAVY